jgi:hypothetical protein
MWMKCIFRAKVSSLLFSLLNRSKGIIFASGLRSFVVGPRGQREVVINNLPIAETYSCFAMVNLRSEDVSLSCHLLLISLHSLSLPHTCVLNLEYQEHIEVEMVEDTSTGVDFLRFIFRMVYKGALGRGDYLILDNAKIHWCESTFEMIDDLLALAGVQLIFLPAVCLRIPFLLYLLLMSLCFSTALNSIRLSCCSAHSNPS